jgi:hypothetical protein
MVFPVQGSALSELQLLSEHPEAPIYRTSNAYIRAVQAALVVVGPSALGAHEDHEALLVCWALSGG